MLESHFNKVVGLKASKTSKKRLQHKCFPVKSAKFLRTPLLQNSSSGCFWGLTHVLKGVRNKNRCDCQQQIPDSVDKKYLLLRKSRSSHRKTRPASLLKRGSSIVTFIGTPILKNTCERLLLKISTSVINSPKGGSSWFFLSF